MSVYQEETETGPHGSESGQRSGVFRAPRRSAPQQTPQRAQGQKGGLGRRCEEQRGSGRSPQSSAVSAPQCVCTSRDPSEDGGDGFVSDGNDEAAVGGEAGRTHHVHVGDLSVHGAPWGEGVILCVPPGPCCEPRKTRLAAQGLGACPPRTLLAPKM